jgi:hypothetical protein
MEERPEEHKADEAAASPLVRLDYHTPELPAAGTRRVGSVVAICVTNALLMVVLFGAAMDMVAIHSFLAVLFFGLAGLCVYVIWGQLRSLGINR